MDLAQGEMIIYRAHPSWRAAILFYIKGLFFVAVGGVAAAVYSQATDDKISWGLVAAVAVGLFVIVLVIGWIKRIITIYMITNQRIYIRRGLISRTEQETRLQRVQNVNTHQSVLERFLAVGNVKFDTAGGEHYDFSFKGVGSPQRVVNAVHKAQGEAAQPGQITPPFQPPPDEL